MPPHRREASLIVTFQRPQKLELSPQVSLNLPKVGIEWRVIELADRFQHRLAGVLDVHDPLREGVALDAPFARACASSRQLLVISSTRLVSCFAISIPSASAAIARSNVTSR
jgi:hypothetical protein